MEQPSMYITHFAKIARNWQSCLVAAKSAHFLIKENNFIATRTFFIFYSWITNIEMWNLKKKKKKKKKKKRRSKS